MKINPKSEKGAITLVVLVGMLFLTVFLMSVYIKLSNKAQTSAETTKKIAEQYNNIEDAEKIYESYFANTDIIPISTKEQLEKIGSNEEMLIDGKVYTFSSDAYYTLKKDLDLGGIYNKSTDTWSGKQWIPITNEFTGTLDGLGHTITGIYLGENEETQGIFKELKGTIKNVYIKDSYKVKNMNGLLAGTNSGEIINSYYEKALIGLKVGDYVNYTPATGEYKVANGTYGTGVSTGESQEFTTDTTLKWRILSIDEETGKIELVSATAVHTLTLYGADGYNHAVDILNDLCKRLYSNNSIGAIARSINVEDINAKTTYNYIGEKNTASGGLTYGELVQLSKLDSGYRKYPNLYSKEELGKGTGFTQTLKENEGLNDGETDSANLTTYKTVTGSTDSNGTSIDPWVTNTYYGIANGVDSYFPDTCLKEMGINTAPEGLISIGTSYWLASRCIYPQDKWVRYCLRIVNSKENENYVFNCTLFYNRRRFWKW